MQRRLPTAVGRIHIGPGTDKQPGDCCVPVERRLVQRGIETGELSASIDAAFVGEMIVGTMNTVLIIWIHDPSFPVLVRLEQVRPMIMNLLELDSRDVASSDKHRSVDK